MEPWPSLAVLIGATVAIAFGAEIVSGAMQATAQSLGLPLLFLASFHSL